MHLHPDLQTILHTVTDHLTTQRALSQEKGPGSNCAYRGEYGTRCAVGVLIADAVYDRRIETDIQALRLNADQRADQPKHPTYVACGLAWDYLTRQALSIPPGELMVFLKLLQRYHDGGAYQEAIAACPTAPELFTRIDGDLSVWIRDTFNDYDGEWPWNPGHITVNSWAFEKEE